MKGKKLFENVVLLWTNEKKLKENAHVPLTLPISSTMWF